MTRYILNSSVEVLVASYGGVGTTFLSQEIARYRRVNDPRDLDGYKHSPVPPLFGSKNLKVIYVYGNPILAAASLFRRDYHVGQAAKLQYSRLWRRIPHRSLTLEKFASRHLDFFRFQEHFSAWTEQFVLYPTLVLKYEKIHDSLTDISKFLNLPEEFVSKFPPQKMRDSSFSRIDRETLSGLEKMYGRLAEKIQSMPNVLELVASSRPISASFDCRYWIGIMRDLVWRGL